jgi:hypothetical protein
MPAIRPLRKLQVALETTPGTPVPATRVLRGSGRLTEKREAYRTEYPYGVRAPAGGAGVITRRWTEWEWESELALEEVGWWLQSGIRQSTPTGSSDPYTWTWEPSLGSAGLSVQTLSLEYLESDGTTNHYTAVAAYGVTTQVSFEVSTEKVATLKAAGQARARQATAPSASATPAAARTLLPGAMFKVWWDTSWTAIGTTQLTGVVRDAKVELKTGWEPAWTLDGRADLDWTQPQPGMLDVSAELTLELDAVAAARIANWRANDLAYVRLAAAPSANREFRLDLAARLDDDLSFGEEGEVTTVALKLAGVYDPASQKLVSIQVKNGSASL